MGISKINWWLWLRNKLLILDRTRLVTVLVVQQLIDLFTTWWLVFHTKTGTEINPLLQVINGENGLAWLVGVKVVAATLAVVMCWVSLAPKRVKPRFWGMWNTLAYAYSALIVWNSYLMWATMPPGTFS